MISLLDLIRVDLILRVNAYWSSFERARVCVCVCVCGGRGVGGEGGEI